MAANLASIACALSLIPRLGALIGMALVRDASLASSWTQHGASVGRDIYRTGGADLTSSHIGGPRYLISSRPRIPKQQAPASVLISRAFKLIVGARRCLSA